MWITNKKVLYRKAYRILDESTPTKFDCGKLCEKKCCSGDKEKGMLLFPDENMIFPEAGRFLKARKEKLGEKEVSFAVCSGTCERKLRPLSCRIFPLVPYIGKDKKLTVIEDPRAKYLCPLLMCSDVIGMDKIFYKKVLNVFRFLVEDDDIRKFIEALSETLDEYIRFTGTGTAK